MKNLTKNSYNNLSLQDLVQARDMFHAHLINKKNVVATAIGRYLIRESDLDKNGRYRRSRRNVKRTLANSIVVDISWPCILVFVSQWEEDKDLLGKEKNDIVPKTIYMPNGKMVPVCTVEAPQNEFFSDSVDIDRLRYPDNQIGGGFPLIVHSQGIDRVASVGCVVTDGHKFYALTNRHVAGEAGELVYSRFGGDRQMIGISSGLSLGRRSYSSLYRGWGGEDIQVNCDAGLIEIDELDRWKTDIFTLGEFGPLCDLNVFNLDLSLIAEHAIKDGKRQTLNGTLVGYGAVSGRMEGEIAGLFYRYKSVGGTEFVSDFLIAGRNGTNLASQRGDSGTLWLIEEPPSKGGTKPVLRPIALHWGQHDYFVDTLNAKRRRYSYGLATNLSNVCRELDVDIVRGWNVDSPYTWGKVGHYTVAACAIQAVKNTSLRSFMKENLPNITFANSKINRGLDTKDNPDLPKDPSAGLCPLADVPDIIWKQSKELPYGRKGDENPNHYADADAVTTNGETLFDLCDSPEKLTPEVWDNYYESIDRERLGIDTGKPISKGLISFRVWQIFDYMVSAAENNRPDKFIFGAGVLAHYVGDACQPLHSSYMSNGDPADSQLTNYTAKQTSKNHHKGDIYQKIINPGDGVHIAYEDTMIDDKIDTIFPRIPDSPANSESIDAIESGQAAGFAVLTLMRKTQDAIKPKNIVETYKAAKGHTDVSKALFEQFGTATIDCLARGSQYLAAIWTAAWIKGAGAANVTDRGRVDAAPLITLYSDPTELPSMHLDTIGEKLGLV